MVQLDGEDLNCDRTNPGSSTLGLADEQKAEIVFPSVDRRYVEFVLVIVAAESAEPSTGVEMVYGWMALDLQRRRIRIATH